MKLAAITGVVVLSMLIADCGGGGSDATAAPVTYDFPAPQANSERIYSRVIIDNANNTIDETVDDKVTIVNADGTYVVMEDDPTHTSVTFGGTTYSVLTENVNVNGSGQSTSYSFTAANGNTGTCTYNPHGVGPDFPVTVGTTWSLAYTFACGNNVPVSYMQTGSVVDVETITVPAGTYSTLKLNSTVQWTDANGTTHTQTVSNWRDINTMISVKEVVSIAYSGTMPTNGYPVSSESTLQSAS